MCMQTYCGRQLTGSECVYCCCIHSVHGRVGEVGGVVVGEKVVGHPVAGGVFEMGWDCVARES